MNNNIPPLPAFAPVLRRENAILNVPQNNLPFYPPAPVLQRQPRMRNGVIVPQIWPREGEFIEEEYENMDVDPVPENWNPNPEDENMNVDPREEGGVRRRRSHRKHRSMRHKRKTHHKRRMHHKRKSHHKRK